MTFKAFRISLLVVLAGFALSSPAARASRQAESASDRCANASLNGTYGFLHGGVGCGRTDTLSGRSPTRLDATL